MWKLFGILAVLAAFRFNKLDHPILAGIAVLIGVIVFWSAGVFDNIIQAERNYTGDRGSGPEDKWAAINLFASLAATGLFIWSIFS